MNIEEWRTQAKRGTLELCILSLLKENDYYGYELTSVLANWKIVSANENTIYPLLRRLTKEGFLESYWQENHDFPRRKYYKITDLGIRYLVEMTISWQHLVKAIEDIQTFEEEK
ncbi:PadR family transcriptional regulator [uncultured Vagococcus sp.]|uniref:PadR family transcriptional regulator n=1 Tax=uncultured Vagococcus sp. TaxID=189676 RepID=UPI0028D821C4|nr:PadR family transcriptional regulator [uncultured Vagococcus sp.]